MDIMPELDTVLRTRLSKFLTSDLLEQLPKASALSQATQRLGSLTKTISSFLPQYIVEDEARLLQDYGSLTEGSFLFADVSGFTALSEHLMQHSGAEGIEVLTQIINDYFATMLEILAKSDGHLLKFAGDALLTFFPHTPQKDEFPKAVKAGLRMQRAMQEKFQPIQNEDLAKVSGEHQLELTMSVGISQGFLFEALVGNISQRDHMIMGQLPNEADQAEKAGLRDEVIISAKLARAYEHMFSTRPLNDEFFQVIDNFGTELGDYEFSMPQRRRAKSSFLFSLDDEARLLEDLGNELSKLETISRFVSSEIVNKLVVKGDHIESENRLATVIFVHFTGFAELLQQLENKDAPFVALLLSQYYSLMQRVISTHGGVLTRSDPYAMGSKLLITFGAPVAHPDDAHRAVETCLDMNRQLEQLNRRWRDDFPQLAQYYPFIQQRMGITQGNVYAGEVGWRQRREYTVMGDDVNLAARLMSRAQMGQVIINQTLWERVHTAFELSAMEPFKAKGKTEPIRSYAVLGLAQEMNLDIATKTPFIGREVFLMSINITLQQALKGYRQVRSIAFVGEEGVGKTRILRQASISAQSAGFQVAWATCRSQATRKTTWSLLLHQLLSLDDFETLEEQKEHLELRLGEMGLPDLQEVLSDLLFDSGDGAKSGKSRNPRRRTSEVTSNIFDRLSSESTVQLKKNDMSAFRAQMKKALNTSTGASSGLPSWSELAMGTGLADALIRLLERFSQLQPVLIVIDDLHKENPRALNILKRVVNEVNKARLAVLVAYDSGLEVELEMNPMLVTDLPKDQCYLMASALLNSSELGPNLNAFIWQSTKGRPLYVESLLETLRNSGQVEEQGGSAELKAEADLSTLPDNIRGLAISRVDRVSPDARLLVRAAAVLDHAFTAKQLAYIAELGMAEDIEGLIEELMVYQIIEYVPPEAYGFKHGVTQQAVYEELTRLQRQKLHLRTAEYFRQYEDTLAYSVSIVYHLLKAGAAQKAVGFLGDIAQEAENAGNSSVAIELYSRALEIFPDDSTLLEKLERLQQA
jgi:class 3 adenylate cyclase/tetratricopeptide (TPR) repeat protein